MPPQPSRSYSRIADRYEEARGGTDRAEQLAALVFPWLTAASKVCDVGVGTGIVAQQLVDIGHDVFGVDISIEMLRQSVMRLPGRVAAADASALPVGDAALDAVLYVWVLHHVGDPASALREAFRVLRPGGRIIAVSGFADPVGDDIDPIFRGFDFALRPERATHDRHVQALAQEAGLSLEHRGTGTVTMTTTPNALADAIDERLYAPLWDLDDERWATIVAPAVSALRGLSNPDEPRHRAVPHPVLVALLTSGGGWTVPRR